MEKTVFISETCFVALIASCLETPHKETGGFLIGKEDKRFIMGQNTECLTVDVAYPVQTCESGKGFWGPGNQTAYNRIKDTINSMSFQMIGEYHSHIQNVPELSEPDKKFIKAEVEDFKKNGVEIRNWIETVLNIEPKAYTRKHTRSCDCSYFKKRIRCNIRGISNPLNGYSITIGTYQFDPETEKFEEINVYIP
jgi:proteasome lid subunit RPN8/RPN11